MALVVAVGLVELVHAQNKILLIVMILVNGSSPVTST